MSLLCKENKDHFRRITTLHIIWAFHSMQVRLELPSLFIFIKYQINLSDSLNRYQCLRATGEQVSLMESSGAEGGSADGFNGLHPGVHLVQNFQLVE